jgi:tetratricopeptide (TPR) repeat protein
MNVDNKESLTGRELLWFCAFLMVAAFCLYANTFGNGWTYDDFPVVVENPDIRSLGNFFADTYPGRPLREVTFLLDHALFGLNPAGYHIQNIFWHGLNAALLFLLCLRLQTGKIVAAGAALLFLVHPLQVEVVANISHRKDSLVVAFSLLAILAYGKAFDVNGRKYLWLLLSFGLTGVAYLAKQNALAIPVIFLAYEWAYLPREDRFLLRYPALFWVGVLAALSGVGLWYDFFGGREIQLPLMRSFLAAKANYFGEFSPALYYLMVLKTWAFMWVKFLLPTALAVEYTYPVPVTVFDPWVLGALAALGLYVGALWHSARRQPAAFFALVWMGAFWLPVSNLWPLSYFAADRYMYAPSAGFFILAVLLLSKVLGTTTLFRSILLGGALLLALLTWNQNKVWRSPETLWTRAYAVSPTSAFALNNLGNIALGKGERLRARDFYARAAEVNPFNPTAHYNLGLIYEGVGDKTRALEHFRRFLKIDSPLFRPQAKDLREHLARHYGVSVD